GRQAEVQEGRVSFLNEALVGALRLQEEADAEAQQRIDVVAGLAGSFAKERLGELELERQATPPAIPSQDVSDLRPDEAALAAEVLAVELVQIAARNASVQGVAPL